jgi:signal peptidase I
MTEPVRRGRWPLIAGLVLVAALALRIWVFGLLKVSTGSMEPTVRSGETVLWTPLGQPRPGDVVVVELPEDPGVLHLKRLIALGPGELELSDGRLYLDGQASWSQAGARTWTDGRCELRESRFVVEHSGEASWEVQRGGDHPLERLGADRIWVLGDARRSSEDSRQWGALPAASLRGRALFVAWSGALCDSGSPGPRSLAPSGPMEE